MSVLSHLEPRKVFSFFEEICAIPHGSGNTAQISNYCVNFAKERGLEYHQDSLGNVIISAPGTPGYENSEPVILQGHMDMVCVKTDDCPLDLARDGLLLAVDGDYVYAKGTSLGGDDGAAVAMMLALLDSPDLPHPPIEALITVDEETGMFGAAGIDFSPMKGKKLINIDSEEEGIFTVSCAGGVRALCTLPVQRQNVTLPRYRITIDGLLGGHSGVEIHKGRGNAITLLGRVIRTVAEKASIGLLELSGGTADNVIAKSAEAVLVADEAAFPAIESAVAEMNTILSTELTQTDPGVQITLEILPVEDSMAVLDTDLERLLTITRQLPQGVQAMSESIPGLVQTSLNLGRASLNQNELELHFALRSSVSAEKAELVNRLNGIMTAQGGSMSTDGDYPAWEYRKDSPLRDLMVEVYTQQYGKPPKVDAIHAGLECGLLTSKRPELDCVSIGPNILDIHSVQEKLSISSMERSWKFLLEVLRRSK